MNMTRKSSNLNSKPIFSPHFPFHCNHLPTWQSLPHHKIPILQPRYHLSLSTTKHDSLSLLSLAVFSSTLDHCRHLASPPPPIFNLLRYILHFPSMNCIGFVLTYDTFFFFFLIYVGCPGQLTRTTTIPHGPLDILQAQEQVRHRGGDRRARNKSHGWPQLEF